jgi:uncharacterized protein YjeT (DUF2065 family)
VVRVPQRVFQPLLPEAPTPERCVEAYYLQRTRLEGIAERKLRRRQLTGGFVQNRVLLEGSFLNARRATSTMLWTHATAGLEVLTGLALIVAPSLLGRLLFGSDLNAAGEATGRISGFVMLCSGWLLRYVRRISFERPPYLGVVE